MKQYVIGDKLIVQLAKEDVSNLIAREFFMKGCPKDLYEIECGSAKIVVLLDNNDKEDFS